MQTHWGSVPYVRTHVLSSEFYIDALDTEFLHAVGMLLRINHFQKA